MSPKAGIHGPCKGTEPALAPSTLREGNDPRQCPAVLAPALPAAEADFQPRGAEPALPALLVATAPGDSLRDQKSHGQPELRVCPRVSPHPWHAGISRARRGGLNVPGSSGPRNPLDLPAGAEPAAGSQIAWLLFP